MTRSTRWPVLALIETIGAKARNGASRRSSATYSSNVLWVLSSTRSHLLIATTSPIALLQRVSRDVRVLRGQAVGRVEHEHGDIGAAERP